MSIHLHKKGRCEKLPVPSKTKPNRGIALLCSQRCHLARGAARAYLKLNCILSYPTLQQQFIGSKPKKRRTREKEER